MIAIIFNKPEFEYDVHSLVKAFFPRQDVEMYYTCEEKELEGNKAACTRHGRDELERRRGEGAWDYTLSIEHGEGQVHVIWREEPKPREPQNTEPDTVRGCEAASYGIDIRPDEVRYFTMPRDTRIERRISAASGTRTELKRSLGRCLYGILSEYTGRTLPWGILIGIRPTKIPMKLLEEGRSPEEIASYMRETHLVSEEKIRLSIEIAQRERKLLSRIDPERGYSLYIGIPFCPSTCLYCSFTSYPLQAWKGQAGSYLDALEREIDFVAERFRDRPLNSVYIGGGTPTTLEPRQLDRLLGKLAVSFDLSHCLEFTVEAGRPDSITEEKLQALRRNGITRISINPQTMKQETLDLIGRRHTVEQTIHSFRLARELDFDNINMDLIIGLPGEELGDVRRTMEALAELGPDNVTIHSLAVKRAARLNLFRDYYRDMGMVNTQEHMELCERYCRRMGLAPYYLYRQKGMAGNLENVGYAAEGKGGIYNILIMEEVQTILALGAGAMTKLVLPHGGTDGGPLIERVENVKDIRNYLERIDEMIERKAECMERRV